MSIVRARSISLTLYPIILVTTVTLAVAYPLFRPGFPLYLDNPMHLAQSYSMVEELLPETKWISGWSNYIFAGLPIALYYSQVGFWLVSLPNLLFGIPVEAAYKLVLIVAYAFPGWALYRLLAPRFGIGAATVGCLIYLSQYAAIQGFASVLGGMWNQALGIGLLLLFIDNLDSLYQRFTLVRVAGGVLLFGLIMLSHMLVALVAGVALLIYLLPIFARAVRKGNPLYVVGWLAMPLLALGLSVFYLLPVIENSFWLPESDFIVSRSSLDQIAFMLFLPAGQILRETPGMVVELQRVLVGGDVARLIVVSGKIILSNLPNMLLGILALAGLVHLVRRRISGYNEHRIIIVMVIILVIALVIATEVYSIVPFLQSPSLTDVLHPPRFVVFVRLGLVALAALALNRQVGHYLKRRTILSVAPVPIVILATLGFNYSLMGTKATTTSNSESKVDDVHRVWRWVAGNVDGSKTRVLYQETFSNLPSREPLSQSHIFGLSYHYTRVQALGPNYYYPFYPTSSLLDTGSGQIFGTKVSKASAEFVAEGMERFNAKYVVTVEPLLTQIVSSSPRFVYQATIGDFNIFMLDDYEQAWFELEGRSGRVEVEELRRDRMAIQVDSQAENSRLIVKYSYHPYWRALVDGQPVKVELTPDYLMAVPLAKSGVSRVTLAYSSFNPLTAAISVASLVTIFIIFVVGFISLRSGVRLR